jgi:hypothetical protein
MRQEGIVVSRDLQSSLIDASEQNDGIMPRGFPKIAVEPEKQLNRAGIPAPAQVVGDAQQWLQRLG